MTYQWYVGESGTTAQPIDGATRASYSTPPLTTTTSFWVRLTDATGATDSETATVTITASDQPGTAPGHHDAAHRSNRQFRPIRLAQD